MRKVRITVIKKEFYEAFAEKYLTDGRQVGACPILNEGDVFVYEGGAKMPEGLCPWAWIDIYNGVSAIFNGASFQPWNNRERMQVLCCTDGIRPVSFLIEAIDSGGQE